MEDPDLHELTHLVRELAARHGRFVAILADLQGPKIRIARFAEGKVQLHKGQPFVLDAELDKSAGDQHSVGIDYEALIDDSRPGDILLLQAGDAVAADARLLDGTALQIAEAALTGESVPVEKSLLPLAPEPPPPDRARPVVAAPPGERPRVRVSR